MCTMQIIAKRCMKWKRVNERYDTDEMLFDGVMELVDMEFTCDVLLYGLDDSAIISVSLR